MNSNVLCVVVDRLHPGMVGAYGNSWIRTTALDRLASQSFLFDQAFLDAPPLERLYRAYWLGLHEAETAADDQPSLPELVAAAGRHTVLVTDEPQVAHLPWSEAFAERLVIDAPRAEKPARDVSATALGRVFAAASRWLASARQPFFLWLHVGGMSAAWDAPLKLRNGFAEDDDPEPPQFVAPPDYWLPNDFDPDEVLGVKHAYAGQVAALDQCCDAFFKTFEASPLAGNTQLTFLSARGYPLGEHRRLGPCDEALYNETAQLVWMMRFPDLQGAQARSPALVQPHDLPGTLLAWLQLDCGGLASGRATSLLGLVSGEVAALRDRLLLASLHDRALRTPGWHLRVPVGGAAELYAKPSDRWEVNEVARLLPDVVAGLEAALAEIDATGRADALPPLAELLALAVE